MLLSMTGFGRANKSLPKKTISVEIKSLNSKFNDMRLKCPQNYREKEAAIRKKIMDVANRGKLEVTLDIINMGGEEGLGLNEALFTAYFNKLNQLKKDLSIEGGDIVQSILRLPNVINGDENGINEEEWKEVVNVINEALAKFTSFREEEGSVLLTELEHRINSIQSLLEKVDPHEKERIVTIRKRLKKNLEEYINKENIDENRFEQEVIYYLEKIDITEEKVRLSQHCKYFLEVLGGKAIPKGKKLNFISQEIGREINTLGAKAYSSELQRVVVEMKDELEKIKEQVANAV